jgi:hypothetical protein
MAVFQDCNGDFFLGVVYSKNGGNYSGNFMRFDNRLFERFENINRRIDLLLNAALVFPILIFFWNRYFESLAITKDAYLYELIGLAALSVFYFVILPRRLIHNKIALKNEKLICMVSASVSIYRNSGNIFLAMLIVSFCYPGLSFEKNPFSFGVLIAFSSALYYCCYRYSLAD